MTIQRRLEKPGLSSQQDPRFAPVGTQLQVVLSAETGELVVSSTCDPDCAESAEPLTGATVLWGKTNSPSSRWDSHESQWEDVFYFNVLMFDITAGRQGSKTQGFFTFTHLTWGSWIPSVDFFVCKAATAHTEHRDNCKFSSLLENGPLNRSLSIALAASFQPSRLKKFGCCKANRDPDWCWVQAGWPCCCLLLHHNSTDNLGAFKQVPWSPHWHWINSFLRRN